MKDFLRKIFFPVSVIVASVFACKAQPIADFIINYPDPVCNPATISFTNTSTGISPLAYQWYVVTDSVADTTANPSFLFSTCGSFLVGLIAIDSFLVADTTSQTVIINCAPTAGFTFVTSSVCDSATAQFNDTSISPDSIVSWNWFFGDTASGSNDSSSLQNPVHFFSAPGNYFISMTIVTINGCTSVFTDTLIIHPVPQAEFTFSSDTVCLNDTVKFFDASLSQDSIVDWLYVFDDPASGVNNTADSSDAIHLFSGPGNYFVKLTAKTVWNCESSVIHMIKVNLLPATDAGVNQTICTNDTAQLLASGGISYQWIPAASLSDASISNPLAFPLAATTYFVTATDSNGCTATDSLTISLSVVLADAGNDTTICYGSSATLNAAGGISFSWEPSSSLSSDTVANPIASPLLTTTYTLTAIDSFGCAGKDSVTVFVNPPLASIIGLDSFFCANDDTVNLQASPPGGIFSGSGVSGNQFFPSSLPADSTYEIIYTYADSIGCTSADTAMVLVRSLPAVEVIGTVSQVCLDGNPVSLTLTPPGGTLSGVGISGETFDPQLAGASGDFQVFYLITDSFGCSNSDSTIITVLPLPNISATSDTTICPGDSIQLNAMGGNSFQWTPSSFLSDDSIPNPVAFPPATTLYFVSGTDSNNCSNQDSVLISVFTVNSVEAGNDTSVCLGNTITLQGTGGNSFLWQPGNLLSDSTIANPIATLQTTTTFTLTSFAGDCSGTDSITIVVNPVPQPDAGNDTTVCSGNTVTLHGSGGDSFLWQPGNLLNDSAIADPVASPLMTTTFTLTAFVGNCPAKDSVTIVVNPSPQIDAGNDTSVCIGSTITLQGSGIDSFSWHPGNLLNDSTITNPIATLQTTTTFTITSVLGQCSTTDSVTIAVNPLPQIDAGNDSSLCIGNSIQLQASGGVSYQWQPANSLNDSLVADPLATPAATTQYTVTGTDANGCSDTDQVNIIVFALPQITIYVDSALCFGDTVIMYAVGATFYQWLPPAGLSSPNEYATLAFPQTTTTYIAVGTDLNGCSSFNSTTIVVHPLPIADAGNDQMVCPDVPVQLSASGGNTYDWQPQQDLNNSLISNPIATVTGTTTYTVTVTDSNFCSSKDSVTLQLFPPLNAFASNDTIICLGTSAQLLAGGGVDYVWIPSTGLNNGNIPNPIASPASTTTYSVFVSDGVCYSDTFSMQVTVQDLPVINAGPDINLISGSSLQFNVTATNGTYQWLPEAGLNCATCLNPVGTPQQTTTYTVTVTDSAGCTASDEITLTVACADDVVFVPDAFTPNGNGHNDVLYIRSLGAPTLHFFRVYDRWGKIIFETRHYTTGWDGNYNGKPMPPGAYLIEWDVTCANGTNIKKQGNVTLLR